MIRTATPADKFRVVEMASRFLLESQYGEMFENRATPDKIGALVDQLLKVGVIFVAELADDDPRWQQGAGPHPAIVGMLAIVVVPNLFTGFPVAEEIAWWVEPEHRGKLTIGPKLLRSAEDWATSHGANMVKMVAPAGSTVGVFYERMGYQPAETAFIKRI